MLFRNTGVVHPDNCCQQCQITDPSGSVIRVPLGVGVFGGGINVMELQFTLSDQPPNVEYDIKRTKTKSTWQRVRGKWTQLDFVPSGTLDNATNDDECVVPKNKTIFVMDAPGIQRRFPMAPGAQIQVGGGAKTSVDATDIVVRHSFLECVIARNKAAGSPWTRISSFFPWHNVMWLTRNSANEWVLDKNRSEIKPGALSEQIIKSAPGP